MRCRATPEGVEAATILILAFAGLPFVAAVNDLPDAVGLRLHYAWAANLVAEQSADGEHLVAEHFGFEADARTASEQAVVRIALNQIGGNLGALAIGGR